MTATRRLAAILAADVAGYSRRTPGAPSDRRKWWGGSVGTFSGSGLPYPGGIRDEPMGCQVSCGAGRSRGQEKPR